MLKKRLLWGFLLPFLGLAACGDPETVKPVSEGAYFNVPGFMQQKLRDLNQQQPALQKTVQVNREKPETRNLEKVNWENELQHFLEIDLNKKALDDAYTVSESSTSTGKIIHYVRKPDVSAPIRSVDITIEAGNKVKKLRAVSEEENGLFFNQEVRLLQIGEDGQVEMYRISGVQKVMLFDSLRYLAEAIVINRK